MINKFRYFCQLVLPLVYDDSLSYTELLYKVVGKINEVIDSNNELTENFNELHEEVTEYLTHLDSDFETFLDELTEKFYKYIQDLDLDDAVAIKLRQMIRDGIFDNLVEDAASVLVSQWLDQHITPTTPPVDSSLTVQGAAADALATGSAIRSLFNNLERYNDLDLLSRYGDFVSITRFGIKYTFDPLNKTYSFETVDEEHSLSFNNIVVSQDNIPDWLTPGDTYMAIYESGNTGSVFEMIFYTPNGSVTKRVIRYGLITVPEDTTGIIFRVAVAADTVASGYCDVPAFVKIKEFNMTGTFEGNANDINWEGTVFNSYSTEYGNSISNWPGSYPGWLQTFFTGENTFQIAWPYRLNVHTRYRIKQAGTWTVWYNLNFGPAEIMNVDADDIITSGIYFNNVVSGMPSIEHMPFNRAGWLVTMATTYNVIFQMAYPYNLNDSIFYRVKQQADWTDWINMSAGDSTTGNPNAHMYSIGNSILTGSVWINGSMDHLSAYNNAPYSVIANAINIPRANVEHELYSNTGLVFDAGQGNFRSHILSKDISDVDVILTHLWTSDLNANITFGDLTSTAGDGTVIGAILDILDYISAENGNCQFVLLGVPPTSYTISGANVFTGQYPDGLSIHQTNELIHQLAEREHFTFVDFEDWNISYKFQSFTDGDNVHANNENTYRIMGAYLGARVSSEINF